MKAKGLWQSDSSREATRETQTLTGDQKWSQAQILNFYNLSEQSQHNWYTWSCQRKMVTITHLVIRAVLRCTIEQYKVELSSSKNILASDSTHKSGAVNCMRKMWREPEGDSWMKLNIFRLVPGWSQIWWSKWLKSFRQKAQLECKVGSPLLLNNKIKNNMNWTLKGTTESFLYVRNVLRRAFPCGGSYVEIRSDQFSPSRKYSLLIRIYLIAFNAISLVFN